MRHPITKLAYVKRHRVPVNMELLTPLQLNSMDVPSSNHALYGMYTGLFIEFKSSGKIPHMDLLKTRIKPRKKQSRKWNIIRQAVQQYEVMVANVNDVQPTREFMRLVVVKDSKFDLSNEFQWVNIEFLKSAVKILYTQLKFLDIPLQTLQFEKPVETHSYTGFCDMYCPVTDTVIELKTCQFVKKEHFVQTMAYASILGSKNAILINCMDGGVWRIHGNHKKSKFLQ